MELDWTLETAAGATLVRVRLRNDRATDRRVRLRNCLDGPALPPRRHGTPEAGWDRDGVTVVAPAGESVALGYACPAPATEPPVAVDDVGAPRGGETAESSPAGAVRRLGDHRPPRDVLPTENRQRSIGSNGDEATAATDAAADAAPGAEPPDPPLPDEAAALLSAYRTRVETAEALSVVGVPEATALLDANGGLAGVEELADGLDADAGELRVLAAAAAALADRAQAASPPVAALRRLS